MSSSDLDPESFEFHELAELLRDGLPPVPEERPSEAVWDRIVDGIRLDNTRLDTAQQATGAVADLDAARSRRSRSRQRWVAPALAAAAVAIAVPLALFTGGSGSEPALSADLLALSTSSVAGGAELQGGTLTVDFEAAGPPEDSSYEVWLLDIDESDNLQDLVWIGRVEGDDMAFDVPDDVDLERFDVVDVSLEPHDGDTSHSGDSVVRGVLGG